MARYYTGIGSRETPDSVLNQMFGIAADLADQGYILRSGAAEGADSAFEGGAADLDSIEIYLPWKGFENRHGRGYIPPEEIEANFRKGAKRIASEVHPQWSNLTDGTQKLHTRNVYQILGRDLKTPSEFVICWAKPTRDGLVKGGTRTAVAIARRHNIPVINLHV